MHTAIDSARIPAAASAAEARARQQRDAYVLAVLGASRGALDIAQMLGLLPAEEKPRRKPDGRPNYPPAAARRKVCAHCGKGFTPHNPGQRCCSRSCGTTDAARRKRGET